MKTLNSFGGQNWLVTPAALAVGEAPPADITHQKWLVTLSGVVIADLKGAGQDWSYETVQFMPDMAGEQDPAASSGPLNWAINRWSIPRPPGVAGNDYLVRFSLDSWSPSVALSAIYDQNQSVNAGFAVDSWRPSPFGTGKELSGPAVGNLFSGVTVDCAVRDVDAWLYRLSYNITLSGRIVFIYREF